MLNRAHGEAVEPIVVVLRIDTATVKVQVPAIRLRVERARPVVTVRPAIVPRRTIAVAGARKCFEVTTLYDHTKGLQAKPSCVFSFSYIEIMKDV